MKVNYDGRHFRSISNSGSGDVGPATTFHYRQDGEIVWATYSGGSVRLGTLIATVAEDGSLDMRYSHVTTSGELATGRCLSIPEILPDGRLRLEETWQWTSGDLSRGSSIIEEVAAVAEPVGILVHGDNHFIVRGPLPDSETATALCRHWSVIRIESTTPPYLDRWRISSREFRENLQWAVTVPGEGGVSPAVATLLGELSARGIALHDSRTGPW